jgi:hypothetical protein
MESPIFKKLTGEIRQVETIRAKSGKCNKAETICFDNV